MFTLLSIIKIIFIALGLIMLVVACLGAKFARNSYREIVDPKNKWDDISEELKRRYVTMNKLHSGNATFGVREATATATAEAEAEVDNNAAAGGEEDQKHNQNATSKAVESNSDFSGRHLKNSLVNGEMIMVDLLIEKAQRKLSERSASYFNSGVLMYVFSICLIIAFALFTYLNSEISYTIEREIIGVHLAAHQCEGNPVAKVEQRCEVLEEKIHKGMHPDPVGLYGEFYHFIFELMKKVVAGGALLGSAYLIAATANSCFRESTILLHRRHLLRYIRLMSYENKGKVKNDDLRDIFGVDQAATTGFDKIKVESLRDNLVGKLIEAIGRLGTGAYQNIKQSKD